MREILLKDIQGEGIWKIKDNVNYEEVVISDEEFINNKGVKVNVFLKDGDSFEYIRDMVSKRKVMPTFVSKGPRDFSSVANALKNLEKDKNKGTEDIDKNILKKVKSTFIKLSLDNEFNYREVSDKIKEFASDKVNFDNPIEMSKDTVINEDFLVPFLICQTIECLDKYSYIHPKIKLLIAQIDKPIGLEFETV